MSLNPGELKAGSLHFTTRGIAEIGDFYKENGLEKIRLKMHIINREDGVTPTGDSILMSTTPEILCGWIKDFSRDIEERRRSVSALKGQRPEMRDKLDGILGRIQGAKDNGPQLGHQEDV
jgi:hypothetical protein